MPAPNAVVMGMPRRRLPRWCEAILSLETTAFLVGRKAGRTSRAAFLRTIPREDTIRAMRRRKIAIVGCVAVLSAIGLFEVRGYVGIPTVTEREAKSWFPVGMSSDDAITALESHGFAASKGQYGKEMQVQGDKSIVQCVLIEEFMHITVHLDDHGRVWQTDTNISRMTP